MATKNMRSNITLDKDSADLVKTLAKKKKKSISGMLKELVLDALELEGEISLSKLAAIRNKEGAERVSHEDAWK